MNILMMTNTYTPHVGGVARSVESFTNEYRKRGHRVLVVAPEFEDMPKKETDVIRLRAIQHFNGSDFSVALPIPGSLSAAIEKFKPDIVHSHHPFLIGATAVRVAYTHQLPLVFTHHTMYEQYTHYVPGDSPALKRFVIRLSTSYANLCDQVFAPSESVSAVLHKRGVTAPIDVVPTGVDVEQYSSGNGVEFRRRLKIPEQALVIGHLGRLAPEKNLEFLAGAVAEFMKAQTQAHFVVVGVGPSQQEMQRIFGQQGVSDRLHFIGILQYLELADALHAMDVFVFASMSETQGMVLTEAMSAGLPVIAVDAPGVREVVIDNKNGRLLYSEDHAQFVSALNWFSALPVDQLRQLKQAALATAQSFSIGHTAEKALQIYKRLIDQEFIDRDEEYNVWTSMHGLIRFEWEMLKGVAGAAGAALNVYEQDNKPVR
jgi:glycosyltransferase involved in cell wall biosynthesis